MAYNPVRDEVYVVQRREGRLDFSDEPVVVCTRRFQIVRRAWIGESPQGIAVSRDGARVFVARGGDEFRGEQGSGTLHLFDTDTQEQTDVSLGDGMLRPELALIGDDRVVVSARFASEFRVVHLDRDLLVESFAGTSSPGRIEFDPRGRFLFVSGDRSPTPEKFTILPDEFQRSPFEIPAGVSDGAWLELDPAGEGIAFASGELLNAETGELIGRTVAGRHAFEADPASLYLAGPPELIESRALSP